MLKSYINKESNFLSVKIVIKCKMVTKYFCCTRLPHMIFKYSVFMDKQQKISKAHVPIPIQLCPYSVDSLYLEVQGNL